MFATGKTVESNKIGDRLMLPSIARGTVISFQQSPFSERFQELREAVLAKKPVLREILEKRGKKNLYEYSKDYIDVNLNPPIERRQRELLGAIHSEVENLLGFDIAESVVQQLAKYYFVSTADHHGPICHPFFLNSNILISLPYRDYRDADLQNVIVLASANISLNNSSFPRGLLFHSSAKGTPVLHRLSFLPSNAHSCLVYGFRPYMAQETQKMLKILHEKVHAGEVGKVEAEEISALLTEIYMRPEVLEAQSFSEQVTKTNFLLWQKMRNKGGGHPTNLIYLEQERLATRLLIDHHLSEDTTIHHMIFDPAYLVLIHTYLEGITGAFSLQEKWGTHLFWGISPEKHFRVQLWFDRGFLVSEDGVFRIPLNPDAIRQALENQQIVPSMLLIFSLLCLYYGLKCLGGFSQVNYLTFMKNGFIKMQVDRGNYRSIEVCARAQTKEIVGDITLAFLGTLNGEVVPATGLDLLLHGTENMWDRLTEQSQHITLEESLNPVMPELYRIIYSEVERRADLSAITASDITRHTHLTEKIQPCAFLT